MPRTLLAPLSTGPAGVLLLWLCLAAGAVAEPGGDAEFVLELTGRRAAAMEAMAPGDLIVIESGKEIPGATGGFAADRDFLYLVGLAEEGMTLVIERPASDDAAGRAIILFLPGRDPRKELWNGARMFPGKETEALTGIADNRGRQGLADWLRAAAARAQKIYHNHDRSREGEPATGITATLAEGFTGEPEKPGQSQRPDAVLGKLRQVKSPLEIAALERSIDITCEALAKAMQRIRPGLYEYQVQSIIEAVFRWSGAEGLGFASIIGSGKNGTTLHYVANRALIADGDLIVMDVGAEYHGYSADVTRTVPANGKFTERQREIYELVLKAQAAGFATVKPGNSIRDVHAASWQVIADAGYAQYFPHGTSHWLGLAVHDAGDYYAPLAPGMVLTVEPGIYLPEESLGVRIEDDVLVTEDGYRILSDGVPRTVEEIEALMAK